MCVIQQYAVVPESLLKQAPQIGSEPIALYAYLSSRPQDSSHPPSLAEVQKETGMSKKKLKAAAATLVRLEMLSNDFQFQE